MPSGSVPVFDIDIESVLQSFDSRGFPYFRLPNELEERFEDSRCSKRISHFMFTGTIGLCLYDAFLGIDYYCEPHLFHTSLAVRLAFVTPIGILLLLLLRFVGQHFREATFVVFTLPASFGVLYLYHTTPELVAHGQAALILFMLYSNLMVRSSFPYACCATAICVVGDTGFLFTTPEIFFREIVLSGSLVGCTAVVSLLSNYHMEKEERISYLRYLLSEQQKLELERVSSLDALTGILNRRAFETRFHDIWENALEKRQPVSLLMMDLDHFKWHNDRHGHLHGDEILQSVAQRIHQSALDDGGIVARYGGEEFIVVLPDCLLMDALSIGETFREAVQTISLTPVSDGTQRHITISIGVATAYPVYGRPSSELINAADDALYKAKASGRNCVWPQIGELEVAESRFLQPLNSQS